MTPRTLQLDFIAPLPWRRWLGLGLVLAAMAVSAHLATSYFDLQERIARLEAKRNVAQQQAAHLPVQPYTEATLREADRINAIIDELTVPWDRLFRAVETTPRDRVALLGIAPDQRAGSVEITGEAADFDAMFDYIDRLQRQPALAGIYVLNHKFQQQDPQHPVRFTVTASWLEHNSNI